MRLLAHMVVPAAAVLLACGPSSTRMPHSAVRQNVEAVLDDWHAAAADSDLPRYLAHLTGDAVFMGTDVHERWTVAQLRSYAERPFSEGRGWRMRAVRRAIAVRDDYAFFDEDLETVNLGPARGSGVLELDQSGVWKIAQYNLALTIPNERFEEVKRLLANPRD